MPLRFAGNKLPGMLLAHRGESAEPRRRELKGKDETMRKGFFKVAIGLSAVLVLGFTHVPVARSAVVADYFFNGPIR